MFTMTYRILFLCKAVTSHHKFHMLLILLHRRKKNVSFETLRYFKRRSLIVIFKILIANGPCNENAAFSYMKDAKFLLFLLFPFSAMVSTQDC